MEIAFIFGSIAKGTENARSDVDLMVIGSADLRTLAPILRPISEKYGCVINPYVLTRESWKENVVTAILLFAKSLARSDSS